MSTSPRPILHVYVQCSKVYEVRYGKTDLLKALCYCHTKRRIGMFFPRHSSNVCKSTFVGLEPVPEFIEIVWNKDSK